MQKCFFKTILMTSCFSIWLASHAFASGWQQQDSQWKYENNGSYITSGWLEDQGRWYYFDANSVMQTGWLQEGGSWYFLEQSGAMVSNTTRNIDGIDYSFDGSGRWIEPVPAASGWNGHTYTNIELGYSITFPDDLAIKTSTAEDTHFEMEGKNVMIAGSGVVIPDYVHSYLNISDYIATYNASFASSFDKELTYVGESQVQFGDYTFTKLHHTYYNGYLDVDLYWHYQDSRLIYIAVGCTPSGQTKVQQALGTIKRLP